MSLIGLSEFDEPEEGSAPAPAADPDDQEQPERRICRVVRCMTVYTCKLPHCAACDGHFDPGKHTEATLCERCYDWQQVEARMTPEQRERLHQMLAGMLPLEPRALR